MRVSYEPAYFAAIQRVEDRHFWFAARNRAIQAALGRVRPRLPAAPRVLEVGCGTGNTLRALAGAFPDALLIGMDAYAEGLRLAAHRRCAQLVQGLLDVAPFRERFHVVALFDVLEHVEDDEGVLTRLRGLIEPGGWLALTVPAYRRLWSCVDEDSGHFRRYEPKALTQQLNRCGFHVCYQTPFMSLLYPLAILSRKIRGRSPGGHASGAAVLQDELRVRPGINGLLTVLLRQEGRFLSAWRRLPCGTSLIALARPAENACP